MTDKQSDDGLPALPDDEAIDAIVACLGDDAEQLRDSNPEDERADNMDAAASLIEQLRTAVAAALAARQPEPGWSDIEVAEMILSDCGFSTEISGVLRDRVAERIARHVAAPTEPSTPTEREAEQAEAPSDLLRRALDLHENAGMPWADAEDLALKESGIDDATLDELIGECGNLGLESLLTTADDLRAFTRSILVHQPHIVLATQPTASGAGERDSSYQLVGEVQTLHELNDSWIQHLPAGTPLYAKTRTNVGSDGLSDEDRAAMRFQLDEWVASPPFDSACTWMPIESAPKDGATLLLRSRKGRVADGCWVPVNGDKGYWAWAFVNQEPAEWAPMLSATKPQAGEQKPVASIYISPNGEREFDDWRHDLPVGRNELYTAPQPEQVAQDKIDAERWRAFIGLEYRVRAEWACNLSLVPVLTEWVDQRAARARGEGERS